jgi:dihydroorotate dehydrogenase (NAD+) catalytic subunit
MKLSPNVTSIEEIALASEKGGADAVSAVNTFVGMGINYKTGKMLLSTKFGGLSGPAIKPLAVAKVNKIYNKVKIPIIGMGGISSFKDIIEFIRAGSSLIQIGTLNYKEPSISCRLYDELKMFLKENNIDNINNLVGEYSEK